MTCLWEQFCPRPVRIVHIVRRPAQRAWRILLVILVFLCIEQFVISGVDNCWLRSVASRFRVVDASLWSAIQSSSTLEFLTPLGLLVTIRSTKEDGGGKRLTVSGRTCRVPCCRPCPPGQTLDSRLRSIWTDTSAPPMEAILLPYYCYYYHQYYYSYYH